MNTTMKTNILSVVGLLFLFIASLVLANEAEKLVIKSGLSKNWYKPMIVTEEGLRRIVGEFEKANKQLNTSCRIVIRVIRFDDRFYETTNLDDVFNDPNIPGREIAKIDVYLRIVDPDKVGDPSEPSNYAKLGLAKQGEIKAQLTITHPDKNWALLFSDALEAQVERIFHNNYTSPWIVGIFFLSIYLLGYRLRNIAKRHELTELAFSVIYNPMTIGLGIGVLLANWSTIISSEWFITLFGPNSGFSWGEYEKVLSERKSFQDNIFWIVVVGLPLAIVANIASGFLQSHNQEEPQNKSSDSASSEEAPNNAMQPTSAVASAPAKSADG